MTALPQFRIAWKDVTRISEDVTTGMTEEQAIETTRATKPMLVYIYDDKAEGDQRIAIEEDKAFGDEKVATGARFFDCYRIDAESAAADRSLAKHSKRLPALVFLRPNYVPSDATFGRFSAGKIFSSMCATMKMDYDNCVATVVKKQADLMKERASLDREREKLDRLNTQINDESSAAKRASLVKERDALQAKLDEADGKLNAAEAGLYVIKAKETAAAS